jgi:hypothetical protein
MTTYDLNPRVNDHIEAARQRARRGTGYTIQLPRDPTERWQRDLVSYWTRFGESVGELAAPAAAPPAAGRVVVRAVRIRPDVVQAITPRDLNVILQRPDPLPEGERLRSRDCDQHPELLRRVRAVACRGEHRPDVAFGGVLLTNNPLSGLRRAPFQQIGETKAAYSDAGFDVVHLVPDANEAIGWLTATPAVR